MVFRAGLRELDGANALVTGSSRNIGAAIALTLADAGANVMINGRTSIDEAESVAGQARGMQVAAHVHMADVSESKQADQLIEATVEKLGGIDILINNTASRGETSLENTSDEYWRQILGSSVDAAFFCCRAAVPFLKESQRGSIVNMGGATANAGIPDRSHVAAAKGAIHGMTTAIAMELAPFNVTVNCVSPGFIDTGSGHVPPHIRKRPSPLGRPGQVDEVAATVRHLVGPGGRFTTGTTIHVNGGWYTSSG
jgi:3-oxoacyl-[acyl-carrier protein] reductase